MRKPCVQNVCSDSVRLHSGCLHKLPFKGRLIKHNEVRVEGETEQRSKKEEKNKYISWHNTLKLVFFSTSPLTTTPPYCYPHLHPNPNPSFPPLPQLILSRKINDLQVQAQQGAIVNLARVGEMF